MATEPTNPVGGEDTGEPILEADAEVAADDQQQAEPQFDDDGNPIDEPEEDEEFELDDDLKLTVPKTAAQKLRELKEGNLRQADYTRKTQELADQRKAFDTERQTIGDATQQELTLFAQASTLGQRLAAYQQVDWNAWNAKAQADYDLDEQAKISSAWMDYQQLKDRHGNAVGQLRQMETERRSKTQQETAKRIEEGRVELARDIGWNDDKKAKLTDYALAKGLSRDDLADLLGLHRALGSSLLGLAHYVRWIARAGRIEVVT